MQPSEWFIRISLEAIAKQSFIFRHVSRKGTFDLYYLFRTQEEKNIELCKFIDDRGNPTMLAACPLYYVEEAGPMTVGGDLNKCEIVSSLKPRWALTSSGGVRASHW